LGRTGGNHYTEAQFEPLLEETIVDEDLSKVNKSFADYTKMRKPSGLPNISTNITSIFFLHLASFIFSFF